MPKYTPFATKEVSTRNEYATDAPIPAGSALTEWPMNFATRFCSATFHSARELLPTSTDWQSAVNHNCHNKLFIKRRTPLHPLTCCSLLIYIGEEQFLKAVHAWIVRPIGTLLAAQKDAFYSNANSDTLHQGPAEQECTLLTWCRADAGERVAASLELDNLRA